jgi:excisionase family DNA binding protein
MKKAEIHKQQIYKEPRRLLSVEETAWRLGLSVQTIYNELHSHTFPLKRKGGRRKPLFDSADIDSYIENLPYDSAPLNGVSS